jgi:O-antigen biosynthesis protein WbqP
MQITKDTETVKQNDRQKPDDMTLHYQTQYADDYYEEYIRNFAPNPKKRIAYRITKRIFDFLTALILLILLAIPMLVIAIAIKIDSNGPAIFKQDRMGQGGKPFRCYKFRSMKTDAPHDMPTSQFKDSKQYQTRVGRFLRRLSLDELPQLFCVLIGTMSLIGYRPLVLQEKNCNEMREKLGVFVLKPGISGYAQVNGRDDVYYKNKAIMDAEYVKRASLLFDLKLMFQTIGVVLGKKGNDCSRQ